MTKAEMIWLASKAFDKNWDYETLLYSDDLYTQEYLADEVYEYVIEMKEIGSTSFREKYKEFNLY